MNKTLLIFALVLPLFAQSKSPTAHAAALDVVQLQRFSPDAQIVGMKGYDLRARKIVVPPGGMIPEHGHATRPGIVYVQRGEIIEYRGDKSVLLKAGDSVIEDADTVHAYKNISKKACVLIAFDVPASK